MTQPTAAEASPGRRRRIVRDVTMVVLAVASLLLLAVYEYGNVGAQAKRRLLLADLGFVAVFWVEFLVRWAKADDGKRFIKRNWYEILGMIPIVPGLDDYAGMRLFRLLRVLRILRLVGVLRRFDPIVSFFEQFSRRSKMGKIATLSVSVLLACALLAWLFEPETFPTFWDALWWAIVTSTTVGYGDLFPTSLGGRVVAVFLMVLGIGLIGTLAGTLSSFLVERGDRGQEPVPDLAPGTGDVVDRLERLARLHRDGLLTREEYEGAKRAVLDPEFVRE